LRAFSGEERSALVVLRCKWSKVTIGGKGRWRQYLLLQRSNFKARQCYLESGTTAQRAAMLLWPVSSKWKLKDMMSRQGIRGCLVEYLALSWMLKLAHCIPLCSTAFPKLQNKNEL
jgi:hypothetical protein